MRESRRGDRMIRIACFMIFGVVFLIMIGLGVRFVDYLRPGANISELMKIDFVWMILLAALARGFRPRDPVILDLVFLLCDSTEEDIDEGTERVIIRTKRSIWVMMIAIMVVIAICFVMWMGYEYNSGEFAACLEGYR